MTGEPVLRRGSTGQGVKRLQRALAARGFQLALDGQFGPATEGAVRAFQAANGLVSDGVVGPRTWAGLIGAAVPQELSRAGARFIAQFEGFRARLYNDPAGHCTIGYGHLVHRGRCNGTEPAEFRRGITEQRALGLLWSDARAAASELARSVRQPLVQHQFDALVSFVFNVGAGAFRGSTLLRELNAGHYDAVPAQLNRWVYGGGGQPLPGLVRRRRAEGVLFAEGNYS